MKFVGDTFISLCIMVPAVSILLIKTRLHHFYGWVVLHNAYTPHFIQSPVDGHTVWFYILAIIDWAVINMGVLMSVSYADFIAFG